jgi:tetratricopeptide (TPR) repeat protein
MQNFPYKKALMVLVGVAILLALLSRLPPINRRLSWRVDAAMAYIRGVVHPVKPIPTPVPEPLAAIGGGQGSELTPTPTSTPLPPTPTATEEGPTPTPLPSPTPLPETVSLPAPEWEKQDWNNCGPATLAQYLRFYNWEGDQFDISEFLKPERGDRNVNVEELVHYVRTRAGWLNAEFRVGGEIDTLKRFIAAGIPIMVEEGYYLDTGYWPNDDRWAGHYLLLTGYNDEMGSFTAQDSFVGPDRQVTYEELDRNWRAFNRVYIFLYLPDQEGTVKALLGPHGDVAYNRQHALEQAQAETEADSEDPFAWFNVGTNLVYFERYPDAARAYDTAREIGLPQRMLRYQFGPFFAYFHAGRLDDLMALTDYALQRTPNSEEALLWNGWGRYRQGDTVGAIQDFRSALEANRSYQDAEYALEFVGANP